jgi:hypothetical protein
MDISIASLSSALHIAIDRIDGLARRTLEVHRDRESEDDHRKLALEVAKAVLLREMDVGPTRSCHGRCECSKAGMGCCTCLPFGEEEMDRAFACGKAFADRAAKEGLVVDAPAIRATREAHAKVMMAFADSVRGVYVPKDGK